MVIVVSRSAAERLMVGCSFQERCVLVDVRPLRSRQHRELNGGPSKRAQPRRARHAVTAVKDLRVVRIVRRRNAKVFTPSQVARLVGLGTPGKESQALES